MTDVDATATVTDAELGTMIRYQEIWGEQDSKRYLAYCELREARARLAAYDAARGSATVEGVMRLVEEYVDDSQYRHVAEMKYSDTPPETETALRDAVSVLVADLDTRTSERDTARDERDEAYAAVVALADEIEYYQDDDPCTDSHCERAGCAHADVIAAARRKGTPT